MAETSPLCYLFYVNTYRGESIPEKEWPRLVLSADRKIKYFERIYTVTGSEEDRALALCAIADQMYVHETIATSMLAVDENGRAGTARVSIGSVSTSHEAPDTARLGIDMTDAGQNKAFYGLLREYMTVYRGVQRCY